MRQALNWIMQSILYILDPVFRELVRRKSGPNDKLGAGENVSAVITNLDDGSQRIVRKRK